MKPETKAWYVANADRREATYLAYLIDRGELPCADITTVSMYLDVLVEKLCETYTPNLLPKVLISEKHVNLFWRPADIIPWEHIKDVPLAEYAARVLEEDPAIETSEDGTKVVWHDNPSLTAFEQAIKSTEAQPGSC